ncbi:MAG: hypothetical protein LC799_23995 [Actinobacteria bacterium]|nr:hypothetical protein [Actinomycetota bacterium]
MRGITRALLAALVVAMPACTFNGIALRQDRRVEIVSPDFREEVSLPVTIDWTVQDFEVTGPDGASDENAGYFAVLVDLDPQPPGEGVEYFARDDVTCRKSEGCPNERYLERRGIFITDETDLILTNLSPAPGVDLDAGDRDLHEVSVILLDGQGHRIGEGSWTATFELPAED